MQNSCKGVLLCLCVLAGLATIAQAQDVIKVDPTTLVTSAGLGPGGGRPFVEVTNDEPAGYTKHVADIQPNSYFEMVVTTTTPGLYSIKLLALQPSDPSTIFNFETRPYDGTNLNDLYSTRYSTPDSKNYGTFGAFSNPRVYVDVDPSGLKDINGTVLTVPLWQGQNIFRVRNVTGRHNQAYSYPPDLTDPYNRPWGDFWSNLQIVDITLTRTGDLPPMGAVSGKVTGDKPVGLNVKRALVMVNPIGTSPPEPSDFWHWGYYTYTKDDGTYALQAPTGTMEIKAGRPSSYQVQGSTPTNITVPGTANISLNSIFYNLPTGELFAAPQLEYYDDYAGTISLLPVDGENGYKMGWTFAGETATVIVDAPEAGLYEVSSSYTNGSGNAGIARFTTDLGQVSEDTQPSPGADQWGTKMLKTYATPLYLAQGANTITFGLVSGDSDYDGFHLRRLNQTPTVGIVGGVVTNTTTGQPLAGATVKIGSAIITTDAEGKYRVVVNAANNLPVTVTAPYQDAPTTATTSVQSGAEITLNLGIAIRPQITLTTANGYQWKAVANTGGAANYSAVDASEAGFGSIAVPGDISVLAPEDEIYGWYRLHFTPPANFLTLIPNRNLVFRVTAVNNLTIDEVDQVFINGTPIGSTGSFPDPPLAVQPAGYRNRENNTFAYTSPPGMRINYREERVYYFPASLLRPGQDNVIAVKVFDFLGAGGITGTPVLEVAPATGGISGRVLAGGTGVAGVRVGASNIAGVTLAYTLTDANGAYTLPFVPAGDVMLGAARPGYMTDVRPVTVTPNGNQTVLLMVAAGAGLEKLNEDFPNDTSWAAKFDALSVANNQLGNEPAIVAGYDLEDFTPIPSSITIEPILAPRSGLMSKDRFSRYASVNSAKLVSALNVTPEPGQGAPIGALPNIILQLTGPEGDDPSTYGFSDYVELDLEGYMNDGPNQRVQIMIWAYNYGQVTSVPVPVPLERMGDVSKDNPLVLTITRVGSYYDFYVNDVHAFGIDLPKTIIRDHKTFMYSYAITGRSTWDWVKVWSGPSNIAAPLGKATQALRVAAGLEAGPAPGSGFAALNVVTTGSSATVIDVLDAVALAKQGL